MSVYIDDMYRFPMGQFGRMKMSHMMADTEKELHKMAFKIGVARKWCQHERLGQGYVHYDIAMSKRLLAVQYGAIEISLKEMSTKAIEWRKQKAVNK